MLVIRGYKIPARKDKVIKIRLHLPFKNEDKYSLISSNSSFPRHVTAQEETCWRWENDKCVAEMEDIAYSHLNEIKQHLARIFFNKTLKEIWEECKKLKDDKPFPSDLYFLLNFPDNEGTMGPGAVQAVNRFFNESAISKIEADDLIKTIPYPHKVKYLIDVFRETAAYKDGYLQLS